MTLDSPDHPDVGLEHRHDDVVVEGDGVHHEADAVLELVDVAEHGQRVQGVDQGQGETGRGNKVCRVNKCGSEFLYDLNHA